MKPGEPSPVTLGDIGERETIRRLARLVGAVTPGCVGIGDDCAVVPVEGSGWDWVLTTDPLIEGLHFRSDAEPERVGHKAVGRVLSDLAAMGAEPLWLLIDVVAPSAFPIARLESVYRGAVALASRFGAAIVGGDTSEGARFELHVFGVGRLPGGTAVLRRGARARDALYVTGELGGSSWGRHLEFEPRVPQGCWLREGGWAGSMMDLSDGLASDLRRLLEFHPIGATLREDLLPVSADARRAGGDALERALRDGEDYELLFSVHPERIAAFEAAWRETFALRCTRIGDVTGEAGVLRLSNASGESRVYGADGFEHFVENKVPGKWPGEIVTKSPGETEAVARDLGRTLGPGSVVALLGDLGAGKTCFVRGIACGLNVRDPVTSPTFALIHEYAGDRPLHHVDLYRIESPGAVAELGLEELFDGPGVTVVEWAERAEGLLPGRTLWIRLSEGAAPDERRITMDGGAAP